MQDRSDRKTENRSNQTEIGVLNRDALAFLRPKRKRYLKWGVVQSVPRFNQKGLLRLDICLFNL